MYKRIMMVTDFSPNSLKAQAPVLAFARQFGSTVLLCHVDEEEEALSAHSSDEIVRFLERVESKRTTWLETLANDIRDHEVECEVVRLKGGYASNRIMEYARDKGIELVAISALGVQGLKSVLVGSTSASVLRNIKRPLLFVGASAEPAVEYHVNSILYPTDFSPLSEAGVKYAAKLCKSWGAKLELFHVLKVPPFIPAIPGEPPLVMPPNIVGNLNLRFQQMLDSLARESDLKNVSWEVTIGQDEAGAISEAAKAKGVDLIVIPKKGRGVLTGLLFGRTAENVAKLSPVPTLLFHPDEIEG